ncbi:hypothetical protein TrVE_jg13806 [Triparma verrucosa]|uniref:Uncharacterized protein n=1 Tax=Triparma verrucosa TaxID=1606542 RepID=A0A9W7CDG6_9STRA|nr:hypothetical protein TrVE_jg13806 [Triparma verrucosa]
MTSIIDARNVHAGLTISSIGGYYDGQSLALTPSKTLSLIYHHSHNHEGGPGLRLYHSTSSNNGQSWSHPTPIEKDLDKPSHDGYQFTNPKNGRVYLIYGYNNNQLHGTINGKHTDLPRGDMQLEAGFRLKVYDDVSRSYSKNRYDIPVRRTEIDRENPWKGETMGAFHCDKASVIGGCAYFAFQKTVEGGGETPNSEVFIMRSRDLLEKEDPGDAEWETLPRGEKGLQWDSRLKLGEEPHIFQVDNDDPNQVMVLWRTEVGIIAHCFSSDGGETFGPITAMTYDGVRRIKNPRGSLTPHRFDDGSVLLIYYNNGHTEKDGYVGRRYYWYIVGRPVKDHPNKMLWTEPELALWWDREQLDDRPDWNADWAIVDGPGYPDFSVLPNGKLGFVESNKLTLRFHVVDDRTLYFLRRQHKLAMEIKDGLVHSWWKPKGLKRGILMPSNAGRAGGWTFVLRIGANLSDIKPKQVICDSREIVTAAEDEEDGGNYITKGFVISVEGRGEAGMQLSLFLTDGKKKARHYTSNMVWDGALRTVSFVVDVGPRTVTSVVDDVFCDGGEYFPEGWTTLDEKFDNVCGGDVRFLPTPTVRFPSSGKFGGKLERFDTFNRPLLVSEVIANGRFLSGGSSKL